MSTWEPNRADELGSLEKATPSSSSRGSEPGPAPRVLCDDGEERVRPARAVDRLRRPPARPVSRDVPAPQTDTSLLDLTHATHELDARVPTVDATRSQVDAEPAQLDQPTEMRGEPTRPAVQPAPPATGAPPEAAAPRTLVAAAGTPRASGPAIETPRVRPSRSVLVAVAVVLALAGLIGAVVLGVLAAARGDRLDAQQAAVEAARRLGEQVTSYDYQSISQDVEGVRAVSVDPFRAAYDERADDLRRRVEATRAQATGTVVAAGLQALAKDRAEVLLFINQTLRGTNVDGQRVEPIRALMTLRRSGGSWRLANLQVG